jgi:hypothetical protein
MKGMKKQMGKIMGKYHILEILSYAFPSLQEVSDFLFSTCCMFRETLIENYHFIKTPMISGFLDLSHYSKNESLSEFMIKPIPIDVFPSFKNFMINSR